jgi:hypothetical protein
MNDGIRIGARRGESISATFLLIAPQSQRGSIEYGVEEVARNLFEPKWIASVAAMAV